MSRTKKLTLVPKSAPNLWAAVGAGASTTSAPEQMARVRDEVLPDVAIYRSQLLNLFPEVGAPLALAHRKAGVGTPKVEWSERYGVWKIHPLVDWDAKRVEAYITVNEIPYNPLHDAGYRSIGCIPCTRPTAPGEEERAGRWAGSDKLECGIHVDTPIVDAKKEKKSMSVVPLLESWIRIPSLLSRSRTNSMSPYPRSQDVIA